MMRESGFGCSTWSDFVRTAQRKPVSVSPTSPHRLPFARPPAAHLRRRPGHHQHHPQLQPPNEPPKLHTPMQAQFVALKQLIAVINGQFIRQINRQITPLNNRMARAKRAALGLKPKKAQPITKRIMVFADSFAQKLALPQQPRAQKTLTSSRQSPAPACPPHPISRSNSGPSEPQPARPTPFTRMDSAKRSASTRAQNNKKLPPKK